MFALKEIVVSPGNSDARPRPAPGRRPAARRRHGRLRAILNASPITEIRTAAVSAVATRALARPGRARVAVILGRGAGPVTRRRDADAVLAEASSASGAAHPCTRTGLALETPLLVGDRVEEALDGADIVCTTTVVA